jgi:ABC-type nitrate/sulfonate/bicarbonate transport system substrate-binding protein
MITRRHFCHSLAAGSLSTLAMARNSRAAVPTNTVSMQGAWVNDAEFIGYFVGLQNGYYQAQGLDMRYLSGGPDVIPESALLAGKAPIALTTPDTTIKAISTQGAKFKIIGAQFQKTPIGVVSLQSHPIPNVKALEGKILAVPPVNMAQVAGMLRLNGIAKSADQRGDRRHGRFRDRRALYDRAGG